MNLLHLIFGRHAAFFPFPGTSISGIFNDFLCRLIQKSRTLLGNAILNFEHFFYDCATLVTMLRLTCCFSWNREANTRSEISLPQFRKHIFPVLLQF